MVTDDVLFIQLLDPGFDILACKTLSGKRALIGTYSPMYCFRFTDRDDLNYF